MIENSMNLDVPLFKQAENSVDCGAICLRMLLAYYGEDVSYREVTSAFEYFEDGLALPMLGNYMIKKGFKAEIVTLNPLTFPFSMNGVDDKNIIRDYLIEKQHSLTKEKDKKVTQHLIDFLDSGGTFRLKIPDEVDIKNEIIEGRPFIAILTSNYLYNSLIYKFNFHFSVVTGFDGEYIFLNDPSSKEGRGKVKFPLTGFLQAVYATSYGDLDNNAFLLIKK